LKNVSQALLRKQWQAPATEPLGGNLLQDMGFTNISILDGGVQAWIDAVLPTKQVSEA